METLSQLPATGEGLKEEQVIRSLQHGLDPGRAGPWDRRAGPWDEASASALWEGPGGNSREPASASSSKKSRSPADWEESLLSYAALLVPGAGTKKFLEGSGSVPPNYIGA